MQTVIEEWDDGSKLEFWAYAGGGAPCGLLGAITLAHRKSDGSVEVLTYKLAERSPGPVCETD